MKEKFTSLLVLVFFVQLLFAQNTGDSAPDFTLKDLNETDYQLSANQGKVILVFLVGYNCSLCIASAPTVKSEIVDIYKNNSNFQALVIDTWNGSKSAVLGFKNTTNIDAKYLQKGQSVANNWSTTYDRLVVIDAAGKIAFKGTRAARSDVDAAKSAVQNSLNNIVTSANDFTLNDGFALGQNYPNPASGNTTIDFVISRPSDVKLSFFDISGKWIKDLGRGYYQSGKHSIGFNTAELKSGIYFYRLETEEKTATKRMVVK